MVSELVGNFERALAEADGYASSNSDNYLIGYLAAIRDAHRAAIEALESDCRMKDELLTAAVGDYNDALAKVRALEAERDEARPLDANELWEMLFDITKDNVPEALTNEILAEMASRLNSLRTA